MRDVLIALIVLGSVPFALRAPRIGVMVYIWLSVMNPHRLSFGFAYDVRWALYVSIVIMIGLLASRDLKWPPMSGLYKALIAYFAWTCVTTVFAVHFEDSYEGWIGTMKTAVIALLIPGLFRTRQHLRQLIVVVVLSVAYYGVKGGVFVLLSGGGDKVFGPPGSFIEDNNYLAVALIMLIPVMRFLQVTEPRRYLRWAWTAVMLLCGASALGSYSRGALLAITAMSAMLWWKGRNKLILLPVAAVVIPVMIGFMPAKWFERMDTISTYQEDESANMRLNSWMTMFNIAKDRPFGAGYEVASAYLYQQYSPDKTKPPQVAHSIYFQVLGAHGFVGLGLYLFLYFAFWRRASALIRAPSQRQDLEWAAIYAQMSHVTIVGFLVGATFLSLISYDVPYYLIAIMVATGALVDREIKAVPDGKVSNQPAPRRRGNLNKRLPAKQ